MSTDSDRRRDLVLLDGVVDAQFGLQCGGSSAREARVDLRRHDAEAIAVFDRTIARSAA